MEKAQGRKPAMAGSSSAVCWLLLRRNEAPSPLVCWEEVPGALCGARGSFTEMKLIQERFLNVCSPCHHLPLQLVLPPFHSAHRTSSFRFGLSLQDLAVAPHSFQPSAALSLSQALRAAAIAQARSEPGGGSSAAGVNPTGA